MLSQQKKRKKLVTQHVFPVNDSGAMLCLTVSAATAHENHFQLTHCQATCKPFLFIYDICAKMLPTMSVCLEFPATRKLQCSLLRKRMLQTLYLDIRHGVVSSEFNVSG